MFQDVPPLTTCTSCQLKFDVPILKKSTTKNGTETVEEQILEKEGRREIMKAEGRTETKTIYLVMPSYAEQHKHQIAAILEKEKKNLCRSKKFEKVFSSINFKVAYANSKNIKQLIVRTKI